MPPLDCSAVGTYSSLMMNLASLTGSLIDESGLDAMLSTGKHHAKEQGLIEE